MKKIYPILGMAGALAILASSCVTNEYDLNNINTEMQIGGDIIELPIGHIDTLTVDSLLKKLGDIEFLEAEKNGDLKIKFDSTMSYTIPAIEIAPLENIIPTIEPISVGLGGENNSFPTSFTMPEKSYGYTVKIPTYTINDASTKLPTMDFTAPIPVNSTLQNFVGNFTIPAGISIPLEVSGDQPVNLTFPCPEQVNRINEVSFAGKGAHVEVSLSLGGLASIATDNTIKSLVVTLPEGYKLALEDNMNGCASLNKNCNQLTVTNYKADASGNITISAYLKSVDMSKASNDDGKITYSDNLSYSLDYGFVTKQGKVSLTPQPSLKIVIEDAAFGDAEVVTNPITIPAIEQSTDLNYEFGGLSPDLASVLHVDFAEGSTIELQFSINNGEELPFVGWKECPIVIGLPQCFRLDASQLQNATLDENTNILSTTIGTISSKQGLILPVKKLDFGDGLDIEVSTGVNGQPTGTIRLQEQLYVKISPEFPSAAYRLENITKAMGDKNIQISLLASTLTIAPETSEIVVNELSTPIPAFIEPINYSISDIRSELRKIERVNVTDGEGNDVVLDVAFSLSECPVSHLLLRNIQVKLPKCLWVEGEGIDTLTNVMTINKTVDMNESAKISLATITIKGIKDLEVKDGTLAINDTVSISGEIAIPGGEVLHGVSNDIIITPMISLPSMHIGEFKGRVNINVGDYMEPQSFDLSEFTSQLQNEDLNIDFGLVAPNIRIEVGNPIGVAIDGTIKLTAHYPDSSTTVVPVPLHLKGGDVTQLCITANPASVPSGYTAVTPDNYGDLFKKIPSSLDFMVEGGIDENTVCTLALGDDYKIDLGFGLELPVALNADVQLDGIFGDLSETFQELAGLNLKVGEVGIVIETTSTLPIELSAEVMALDKEGKKVEGIALNLKGSIGGCEKNGAPKTSTLNVSVGGDLDKLQYVDAISYKLKGVTTAEEAAYFNVNQYLLAKAYVRIKDGVSLDISNLLENDEE